MQFDIEIEFKYNAAEISRLAFDNLVKTLPPFKKQLTLFAESSNGKDSIDHYYSCASHRFLRFREGQDANGNKTWEMSAKKKLSKLNNNKRIEGNIDLNAKTFTLEKAETMAETQDLEHDFSIKKDVQIYFYEKIVLSHYTTFNMAGKYLNTFLEIEANEKYNWDSEEQAMNEIVEWEKKFAPLGLTPQHRIKKSLFEFYTKFK